MIIYNLPGRLIKFIHKLDRQNIDKQIIDGWINRWIDGWMDEQMEK